MKKPHTETNHNNSDSNSQQTVPTSPPEISPCPDASDSTCHKHDSDRQTEQFRAYEQQTRKVGIHDWIMVLATVIIAVATAFYTFIAREQWRIMSKTLNEMQSSGKESSKQTDRIITEAERIADSAKESAKQSKIALDAAIESSRLDQRAWVMLDHLKVVELQEGSKLRAEAAILNSGKTPALKMTSWGQIQTSNYPLNINKHMSDIKAKHTPKISKVLYPKTIYFIPFATDQNLNKEQVEAVKKRSLFLYVAGELTYEDVFNRPHVMRFCGRFVPETNRFEQCDGDYDFAN